MSDSNVIISAFADEDQRLRSLVESLSPDQQIQTFSDGQCVRSLLCHISAWDKAVIEFYTSKIEGTQPSHSVKSFAELEEQNRCREVELLNKLFSEIYDEYIKVTSNLQSFLLNYWDQMSEEDQGNFSIPLQHRRLHRHQLEEAVNSSDKLEHAHTA